VADERGYGDVVQSQLLGLDTESRDQQPQNLVHRGVAVERLRREEVALLAAGARLQSEVLDDDDVRQVRLGGVLELLLQSAR